MPTLNKNWRKNLNGLRPGELTLYVIVRMGTTFYGSDLIRSCTRPAYFRDIQKLFVSMPSDLHEAPLGHLGFSLESAVSSMPLRCGSYNVSIQYHRNTLVQGESGNCIPDVHLTISADGGAGDPYLQIPQEFLFIECAFTETETHVKKKFKNLIKDHPDTLAVMMIKITEVPQTLPALGSAIVETHIGELAPKARWLPLPGPNNLLSAIYNGVTLLDVESVSVTTWIRDAKADKPIDLDNHDRSVYAKGVSHYL